MTERQYAIDHSPFDAFRSPEIQVQVATTSWQKQRYFALRREVFAREQKILPHQEQDADDFRAIAIIALASNCGMSDDVVGAVRIYPVTDATSHEQLWFGGRLCVAASYRRYRSIGKGLINEAVCRAKALGGTRFLANVQRQNEAYFQALHWHTVEYLTVAGRPHARMQADLSAYPLLARGA
ncbi:MSMEG_0567/Sll0786 family nitrogen starvation N-acetyltransferase [Marinobacter caseinilyticus]|uniref:MSMEG_0567/Sll0786 family nitrogen starvation N-acetyltransferase n=1 Tax=Marinobacter caseinilyticus TaxID=2692195 RepID=UPI001407EF8B|nr:MSMEG_0567/Sll0786 family nitrogen starvation N-acetyltransferase [Marinobacter caseinilyticus]